MLIYYVRHGDPIYEPDSLTELGLKQADALANRLKRMKFDKIYCSPSNRAILTGLPTINALKKDYKILDWLSEGYAFRYYSVPFEKGKHWGYLDEETKLIFNRSECLYNQEWYKVEGFKENRFEEGVNFFNETVDKFMEELGYHHDRDNHTYSTDLENDERKILIFAHEGMGYAFLSSLLEVPYPLLCMRFGISHSSLQVIKFDIKKDNIIPKILTLSNDSHLYKEGIPTRFNHEMEI